jgi:hypothetical protein
MTVDDDRLFLSVKLTTRRAGFSAPTGVCVVNSTWPTPLMGGIEGETAANEMARLLNGTKTMIIRGAAGRKLPYGKVQPGDALYIVKNDGKGMIEARGVVDSVLNSDKMTPEASAALVNGHQAQLLLTEKQLTRLSGSGTTAPTLDEEV